MTTEKTETKIKVKRSNYAHSLRYAKHIDNALLAISEASKCFKRNNENNEVNKKHFVDAIASKCSLSESTSKDVLCVLLKNHNELAYNKSIHNALLSTQAHSFNRLLESEKREEEAKTKNKKA
jgi:hypothetical protein